MRKIAVLLMLTGFLASCGVDKELLQYVQNNSEIQLTFPENNLECTEGILLSETQSELIFSWEDELDASPYIVHLTNILTNQTQELESATTELSIVLERGTPYSWYVSGISNAKSEVWNFYNAGPGLESFIPFPAEAISPVSGASISQTSTSVNLIWSSEDLDDDIIGYDLYFGEETNPPLRAEDLEESRFDDIPVSAGRTYYWKVITKDSIGNESESLVFSFTVG